MFAVLECCEVLRVADLELQVLFFGAPRACTSKELSKQLFRHANAPPIEDLRGVLWDCHTVPTG